MILFWKGGLKRTLGLLLALGLCLGSQATECDNLTQRSEILGKSDALPVLNTLFGELVDSAIAEFPPEVVARTPVKELHAQFRKVLQERTAPAFQPGDIPELPESIRPNGLPGVAETFRGHYGIPFSQIEFFVGGRDLPDRLLNGLSERLNWADQDKTHAFANLQAFPFEDHGIRVPFRESIFGTLRPVQSGLAMMPDLLVGSIRLGQQVVGADKIGHFFAQGYYHYLDSLKGVSIESMLRQGQAWENSIMGIGLGGDPRWGSGVASFADIAANLAGFLFWYELFDGDQPYLALREGRIVRTRGVQISTLPLAAWDEGINPNRYHPKIEARVKEKIQQLNLSPPIDFARCAELSRLPCAELFLHPDCFQPGEGKVGPFCPTDAGAFLRSTRQGG